MCICLIAKDCIAPFLSNARLRRYTHDFSNTKMANTYHQVYLQTVFAVKYRQALLRQEWRSRLLGVVGTLINDTSCKTIIVNGVEDHIHCLLGLKPAVRISDLMQSVKAKSSKYINDQRLTPVRFEWQEGYGVFSYSHSQIDAVFHYIKRQEEHHMKIPFKEEYIGMLRAFQVAYDPQYIFHELI